MNQHDAVASSGLDRVLFYGRAMIGNTLGYALRQLGKARPTKWRDRKESKSELFSALALKERGEAQDLAARLRADYHLESLWQSSSAETYRVNLFYLELFERAFNLAAPELPRSIDAADPGAAQWSHVHALRALLQWWASPSARLIRLFGYETDPLRGCGNDFSRLDQALGHIRGLEDVYFVPRKFKARPHTFNVITLIFPHLCLRDHLQGGLPPHLFGPRLLLREIRASLRPGGILIVVNAGEEAHWRQHALLTAAGLEPTVAFTHRSLFYRQGQTHYVSVAVR